MDSYELEAMRKFMDALGNRLNQTKGDDKIRADLNRINRTIERRLSELNNTTSRSKGGSSKTTDDMSKQLRRLIETMEKNSSSFQGNDTRKNRADKASSDKSLAGRYLDNDYGDTDRASEKFVKVMQKTQDKFVGINKSLSDMAGHIKLFATSMTGAVKSVDGFVERNANAYRSVLNSSEGSIKSIMQMRDVSNNAGLTFEDFSKAMETGSDGVRLLGGIQWANMNKKVRETGRTMGMFGMTVDQIMDTQSLYLQTLKDQGIDLSTENRDLSSGMVRLIKSSETMANIMGTTRDEQLKLAAQAARDKNFNMALRSQGFDNEQITQISTWAQNIEKELGAGAAAMYKDMLTFGTIVNEDAALAAAAMPELVGAMDQVTTSAHGLKNGLDPKQFSLDTASRLKGAANEIGSDPTRMLNAAQLASIKNNQNANMFGDLINFQTGAATLKVDRDAHSATQTPEGSFEDTMLEWNDLKKRFESGIQSVFTSLLGSVLEVFGDEISALNGMFGSLADNMTPLVQSIKTFIGDNLFLTLAASIALAAGAFKLVMSPLITFTKAIIKISKIINNMDDNGRIIDSGGEGGKGKGKNKFLSKVKGLGIAGVALGVGVEGYDYYTGEKEANVENLTKTGLSIGGGAAGGALAGAMMGSVIPGLGTAIGGIVGGIAGAYAGDSLGDWIFSEDKKENKTKPDINDPSAYSTTKENSSYTDKDIERLKAEMLKSTVGSMAMVPSFGSKPTDLHDYVMKASMLDNPTNDMSNDSFGNNSRTEYVTKRNNMGEENLLPQSGPDAHLRTIRDINQQQIDLLKEEIHVLRTSNNRIITLLEESNRNTRELRNMS